jgi:hypothetical protein
MARAEYSTVEPAKTRYRPRLTIVASAGTAPAKAFSMPLRDMEFISSIDFMRP